MTELDRLIDSLSPAKRELLLGRLPAARTPLPARTVTPRVRTGVGMPLSFAQRRLWFLDQLVPGNPFYSIPAAVRLTGPIDARVLEEALNEVVRRHEALRTTFRVIDGEPRQVVAERLRVPVVVVDLADLPEDAREAETVRVATEQARRPFDLAVGPLVRCSLIRSGDDACVLVLTLHHIVADGWSMNVLFGELSAIYGALRAGRPSPLPALEVQYPDFAVWQREWLRGEVLDAQLAYWRTQLADLAELALPTDRRRPAVSSFRGARHRFVVGPEVSEGIERLGREAGVTPFMTLLTGFAVLLSRYTGQDDIVVGSPIANRNRAEIEGLIGFFVNTLVMRVDTGGNPTFRELLQRVREVALEAYAHQDLPFERLVEELAPHRDLSRNPLVQVMFQLQNTGAPRRGEQPALDWLPVERGTASFDVACDLWHGRSGFEGQLEYSSDLFDAATIERMAGHFATLLRGASADPDRPVGALELLSEAERHELLVERNATAAPLPDRRVHDLVAEQARRTPSALAVGSPGGGRLTFGQLERRANQLAHLLARHGVGPDVPVGVCLPRCPELVVALLGVLKAGGAFVPIDPSAPRARQAFMLSDTGAPVLLTSCAAPAGVSLAEGTGVATIDVGGDPAVGDQPETPPEVRVGASHLAYLIYTSGTTGEPKAAGIEHRSLLNHALAIAGAYGLSDDSHVLQFASPSFDVAAEEIFPTLIAGGTVVVGPAAVPSVVELLRYVATSAIDVVNLPTAYWHEWVREIPSGALPPSCLRLVVIGTEAAAPEHVQAWRRLVGPHPRLFNAYGPTETTITALLMPSRSEPPDPPSELSGPSLPIGRPIANVRVYVLDRFLQPVPIGVASELFVAGAGVARGYHNQPGLTSDSFIPNPFEPGVRMYCTGDLVRHLPDGTLEFLGRRDTQVKIRGHRIELAEIEHALRSHPSVREATVGVDGAASGGRRLVGYVACGSGDRSDPGRARPEDTEQIAGWRAVYDEIYRQDAESHEPTFNIIGWNSTYTGLPLPRTEMREWLDTTVETILSLRPQRVLEIGCGTGMVLFAVAPHCERYVGTDFSPVALDHIRPHLPAAGLDSVELIERDARDLGGFEPSSFDTVILNSVIQYFPSRDYLLGVLRNVEPLLCAGGRIFVGDVRNARLLEAFHASVELRRAPPAVAAGELRERVRRRVQQEQELVVDPRFFGDLAEHLPRLRALRTEVKRARAANELSLFRYDVTLRLDVPPPPGGRPTTLRWSDGDRAWKRLELVVEETRPDCVWLREIPNARVLPALGTVELLAGGDDPATVGALRRKLHSAQQAGVDPDELRAFAERHGYEAYVTWSPTRSDGCIDVTLSRRKGERALWWDRPAGSTAPEREIPPLTNRPLQAFASRRIVPELREHLLARLPEYMVPSSILVLERLPRTESGKLDRSALPGPDRPHLEGAYVAPRSPVEEVLAGIWSEILGLEQIGVDDNFFTELGGHSLLGTQLVAHVREAFGVELPLRRLFEHPTVSELAAAVAAEAPSGRVERIAEVLLAVSDLPDDEVETMLTQRAARAPGP